MRELSKTYQASQYEDQIYKLWESSDSFQPNLKSKKEAYTIAMPPPNATGTLHLGHATMLAIEDILIRFKRMQGHPTLWIPGTDHAAIATQNKVESLLQKKGTTRDDLGREKFLDEVRAYVAESQSTIRNQIRKMGSSCDWSRERYTLDDGLSHAVREIFVRMYKDGLIYRGHRIVNWCTRCASTLADDEVTFKEEKTKFYYFKYGPVVIGTARPETKFLDKVIVVHPDDPRYKKYHWKSVMVPWITGQVEATFIPDAHADPEFGSGAMTITPAHDFIDFEIAQKNDLKIVQIIGPDGRFTDVVGPDFAGKNARESREEIVQMLAEKGLVDRIDENYVHNVSVCYRCGTVVEPLISQQWFIDVNKKVIQYKGKKMSMKERALQVVRDGDIQIVPDRFDKIYFHWLENLRDWCISRQIWWGHQLPVWYCSCGEIVVQNEDPASCPKCKKTTLQRDPDTLDTWFSSGLWTFSTLGWPEQTADLKRFHPTAVLETGYDILFFWVARMILMTTYALNAVPFKHVYLHGLVRDREGRKMSKSLNNGIDPLDMIAQYGADAVRLSLVLGSTPGNDIRLYEEKIASQRNFVNKIWNSARFVLFQLGDEAVKVDPTEFIHENELSAADKWILSRTQHLIKVTTTDLEKFYFAAAGQRIYDFTWGEFCDWYIEVSKHQRNPFVLQYVLQTILKLLHPFIPFVTEVLWKEIGMTSLLIAEPWPEVEKRLIFKAEERDFDLILNVVSAVRKIRAEKNIPHNQKISLYVSLPQNLQSLFQQKTQVLERLLSLEDLQILVDGLLPENAITVTIPPVTIAVPLGGLVDPVVEIKKTTEEIARLEQSQKGIAGRLKNKAFLAKAPQSIVDGEKEKFEKQAMHLTELKKQLKTLGKL